MNEIHTDFTHVVFFQCKVFDLFLLSHVNHVAKEAMVKSCRIRKTFLKIFDKIRIDLTLHSDIYLIYIRSQYQ